MLLPINYVARRVPVSRTRRIAVRALLLAQLCRTYRPTWRARGFAAGDERGATARDWDESGALTLASKLAR